MTTPDSSCSPPANSPSPSSSASTSTAASSTHRQLPQDSNTATNPDTSSDNFDDTTDIIKRLKAMTTVPPVIEEEPTTASSTSTSSLSTMGEFNSLSRQTSNSSDDSFTSQHQRRPTTPRAQTDPSALDMFSTHSPRPRNRSPYSRSHLRSHSSSSSLSAPPMLRAHSLPSVINSSGHLSLAPSPIPFHRPASPLRSPKRTRSPMKLAEDSYIHSGAPSVCDISEDAELELTPRASGGLSYTPLIHSSPTYASNGPLPRPNRRRPASPLYHTVPFGSAISSPAVRTPTSNPSSPLLSAQKFNEPFPGTSSTYSSSVTSSMPSTPTSMRSRSPSISSLETIPDTPDAEAEAIEEERIAKMRAIVEGDKDGEEGTRRSSLDVPGERRTLGFGKRDARKRWSVCGAERRGDLDLETIWED
ncbi:hypothetical protein BU24DRAFT_228223 [Aaosphaeria arxii CBS 175.79]|uniref:Basic proline-rich protein n=1 Tax=Aaosphaeria arxii CBS 175.79 TaxID=1450172 RepID=A0A6A5XQU0_9PLEO|nr:uncharacterized protein BU24DRAFT_228223 [Aaosphaeria arxii CBS 175.79]KAF2015100.1 hypothetical protein BU24DRAFT_228223 [Aaosphaeria arxii CBS 175.79]